MSKNGKEILTLKNFEYNIFLVISKLPDPVYSKDVPAACGRESLSSRAVLCTYFE